MKTTPDSCPGLATSTKNHKKKSPAHKKRGKRTFFFGLFLLLGMTAGVVMANFSIIKNNLLLRFASPQVYLAFVETNYLQSKGKEWQENSRAFFSLLEGRDLSGAKADLHINHLLTSFLQSEDAPAKKPDLSGMSLHFLNGRKDALSLFQISAQVGGSSLASLDFLSDAATEQFFISCPQAGDAALVMSTAQDDPFIMLLHYLIELLQAFGGSVYSTVQANPYAYLLPYLDVVTNVTMERNVPVPAQETPLTATRLEMLLSLDTALDLAAAQLAEMKNSPAVTDPLLPCYELSIELLRYVAAHYPADLGIRAYVDGDGKVLGHEFFFFSEGETLFSLTGILTPSPADGKSGELTLFSALGGQPLTISFSVSQLGFDTQTGLVTGKVNFSCDRFPALQFQLLFGGENKLPKLSLFVRALGVTAVSLELMPTNQTPAIFPEPDGYKEVYQLEEFSSFLQSLDFSGIRSDFYDRTGISFPALPFPLE